MVVLKLLLTLNDPVILLQSILSEVRPIDGYRKVIDKSFKVVKSVL